MTRIDRIIRVMMYGKRECPVYRLLEIRNTSQLMKEYCSVYDTLDEETRILYCHDCEFIPPHCRRGKNYEGGRLPSL